MLESEDRTVGPHPIWIWYKSLIQFIKKEISSLKMSFTSCVIEDGINWLALGRDKTFQWTRQHWIFSFQ